MPVTVKPPNHDLSDDSKSSFESEEDGASSLAELSINDDAQPTDLPVAIVESDVLPEVKTSPQTDLNRALQDKNAVERENFMLLLEENVKLKRSNETLKKDHDEIKSEMRILQQTNEALLNSNEVLMQQVKDIKQQMKDIMEAALKAKERTEAQLAISNGDKVHLDIWPDESPSGKLWYDKKMVDLHDKVQLLSDDIEKSDDDYNRIKKNLDNQLFLNKKFQEKMSDTQMASITQEVGELDKFGEGSETSGSQLTLTRTITHRQMDENAPSKLCIVM